jgi:hypothetical protein
MPTGARGEAYSLMLGSKRLKTRISGRVLIQKSYGMCRYVCQFGMPLLIRCARIVQAAYNSRFVVSHAHQQNSFAQKYAMFEGVPPEQRPERQTPQCEGLSRDRIVFRTHTVDPGRFEIHAGARPDECVIDAGAMVGVGAHTVFEVRQLSERGVEDIVLCAARAVAVDAARTVARIPPGVWIPSDNSCRAFIVRLGDPLTYAVLNAQPDQPGSAGVYERLLTQLGEGRDGSVDAYRRAAHTLDADLILRVDADNIFFDRRDPQMSFIDTFPPRVPASDVDIVFPEVMAYVARFNFYLAHDNPAHPLADLVEMVLVELEAPNGLADDDDYMVRLPRLPPLFVLLIVSRRSPRTRSRGFATRRSSCTKKRRSTASSSGTTAPSRSSPTSSGSTRARTPSSASTGH